MGCGCGGRLMRAGSPVASRGSSSENPNKLWPQPERVLFQLVSSNAMISAYFDDSGTHTTSEVVVVAGILATEGRLTLLERGWKRELEKPIEGRKGSLKRFHMTDCFNSTGEYMRWS